MIKFSHSVFALPFALVATFLAARQGWLDGDLASPQPTAGQLGLILLCMVSARSAAMTFNRLADAVVDARNPRTAGRAIPAGTISVRQAWGFYLATVALFVLSCAGFWWFYDNLIPLALSLPVLGFLCFYSYTKRFTRWSHVVLGAALALSPLGAWLAIHPASVGGTVVVLMAVVTTWVAGFDIIYACQDIEFDKRHGLHSLPARMGPQGALWLARSMHFLTVVLLIVLGQVALLGWFYGLGVVLVIVLLLVEHSLVRGDDFSKVNVAFFTMNGLISLALGGLAIADCLLHSLENGGG
jgi:4-hydroxybenzoate polyprenyltransferase